MTTKEISSIDSSKLNLFQRVGAIERVALGGDEPGVGNDAAQLSFVGAVFYTCGEDNIFFDQDAADVVRAELQADLADFDPGREPARLDVIDVVEIEAADGQSFQVIEDRKSTRLNSSRRCTSYAVFCLKK